MELHRISCKLYAEDPGAIGPGAAEYIPVFHRWIQGGELSGLLIDVADYGHVASGPGVMLIGHESDRSLDLSEGRPGFVYARKRDASGSVVDRVAQVIREASEGAARIEGETALEKDVHFGTRELRLVIADRLKAPNTDRTFAHLDGDLAAAITQVFPEARVRLVREGDERRPFTVRAHLT